MQRYADLLSRGLRSRGHKVEVIAPRSILRRLAGSSMQAAKFFGYVDKFLLFPRRLKSRARAADIVHICDHSNSMYVRTVHARPHVITCHDLLAVRSALDHFPENPVSRTGKIFQRLISRGLRQAACIICVSEQTRDDLRDVLAIPPERMTVVHSSLHWPYTPASPEARDPVLREMGLPPGREYFLHVGGNHWYKNRYGVLQIFRELRQLVRFRDAVLVLAGQPWPDSFASYLREHQLAEAAVAVEHPSNEQLRALYSGSAGLIFPSLYEGFGWPILEAQACGCPVFIPDQTPMNAAAGEGAVYIEPGNPARAAASIAHGLRNSPALREAGFRNLQRFDPEGMIDAYVHIYQRVRETFGQPAV